MENETTNPATKAVAEQLTECVQSPKKEREIWFHLKNKDRKSGLQLQKGIYRSRSLPQDAWTYVMDQEVAVRCDDGTWTTRWERAVMTDTEMLDYLGKQLSYLNRFAPIRTKHTREKK